LDQFAAGSDAAGILGVALVEFNADAEEYRSEDAEAKQPYSSKSTTGDTSL
jgi:hypothetical protein